MMTRTRINNVLPFALAIGFLLTFTAFHMVGCVGDGQPPVIEQSRFDQVYATLDQREREATTKPAEVRDRELAAVQKQREALKTVEAFNAGYAAARGGDDPGPAIAIGVSQIPVIGPYGALLGLAASLGWGFWRDQQARKAQRNNVNIVKSIEATGPEWTKEQKAAVRIIQGEETTAAVEQIKATLSVPEADSKIGTRG